MCIDRIISAVVANGANLKMKNVSYLRKLSPPLYQENDFKKILTVQAAYTMEALKQQF